jgi:hypothetical protein
MANAISIVFSCPGYTANPAGSSSARWALASAAARLTLLAQLEDVV